MLRKVKSYFSTLIERWPAVSFLGLGFYCAWIWLSFNSTTVVNAHAEDAQSFMVLLTYIVSTATIGCFSYIWERSTSSP